MRTRTRPATPPPGWRVITEAELEELAQPGTYRSEPIANLNTPRRLWAHTALHLGDPATGVSLCTRQGLRPPDPEDLNRFGQVCRQCLNRIASKLRSGPDLPAVDFIPQRPRLNQLTVIRRLA